MLEGAAKLPIWQQENPWRALRAIYDCKPSEGNNLNGDPVAILRPRMGFIVRIILA